MKEYIPILLNLLKDVLKGLRNIYLVIVWVSLLPFIYLFDRLFGEWKDEKKEKTSTRQSKRD